jgi:uncharacterized membrane protein YphA (DoxX/SURF4 family)
VAEGPFPSGSRSREASDRLRPAMLTCLRLTIAVVWIYEGLWLKIIHPSPHELAVMRSVAFGPFPPERLLCGIGCGEVLLGLGVLTRFSPLALAWVQAVILIMMNGIGILFGGHSIPDPAGLIIHNLPFFMCIVILGLAEPVRLPTGRAKGS